MHVVQVELFSTYDIFFTQVSFALLYKREFSNLLKECHILKTMYFSDHSTVIA